MFSLDDSFRCEGNRSLVQEHVNSRGNSAVNLYENVQNKPQNRKKFDGARKWVSKPSYQAKFKMTAMK